LSLRRGRERRSRAKKRPAALSRSGHAGRLHCSCCSLTPWRQCWVVTSAARHFSLSCESRGVIAAPLVGALEQLDLELSHNRHLISV